MATALEPAKRFSKIAYLLHQFKRKEEVDLLRSIYGRLFFQVSIYSRRGARVDYLSRKFGSSLNDAGPVKYRSDAESIIRIDEDEAGDRHGQRVAKIFHDADFVINSDLGNESLYKQINRFCDLIFSSNKYSPSRMEYGMFAAKSAALRTLDLSRQVGAAIFSKSGEIVAVGSNEVPKAGGGSYWADDDFDAREYLRGIDSNDARKEELLRDILSRLKGKVDVERMLKDQNVRSAQFLDALEYGRIVHAEMSAISDAARLGVPIKGGTLYTTTFPCHMCAKHIVASGIERVIFLEPYPKSLASDLHSDSIEIERGDRGQYEEFPAGRL